MTQKLLCDPVNYDPRGLVPVADRLYGEPFSNIYLRLISIFFMALAPAVLFYYFSRRYSFLWGSFSALLCLSTWFYWWYGLEARPYIHFLTLTTFQMILFIEIIRQRVTEGKLWFWLGAVNVLLALTVTTSVFQIALIGIWCGVSFRGGFDWRKVTAVFILPLGIAFYYYAVAVKGHFWFVKNLTAGMARSRRRLRISPKLISRSALIKRAQQLIYSVSNSMHVQIPVRVRVLFFSIAVCFKCLV
jgi:hypothetical protein